MSSVTRQQRTRRVSDCTLGVIAVVFSAGNLLAWADAGPTVQAFPIPHTLALPFLTAATIALVASIIVRWTIHQAPRWLVLGAVAATALSVAGMLAGLAVTVAAGDTAVLLIQVLMMTGFSAAFLAALIAAGRRQTETGVGPS